MTIFLSLLFFHFGAYSETEPRHPIPNMTVKHFCGENTSGAVLWENSTMPKSHPHEGKSSSFTSTKLERSLSALNKLSYGGMVELADCI